MSREARASIAWVQSKVEIATGLELEEELPEGRPETLFIDTARAGAGPRPHAYASRPWMDFRFPVKAIVEEDQNRADAIAEQIEAALDGRVNESVPGYPGVTIYHCIMEEEIRYPERDGDRRFFHRGGLFFIRTRRSQQ